MTDHIQCQCVTHKGQRCLRRAQVGQTCCHQHQQLQTSRPHRSIQPTSMSGGGFFSKKTKFVEPEAECINAQAVYNRLCSGRPPKELGESLAHELVRLINNKVRGYMSGDAFLEEDRHKIGTIPHSPESLVNVGQIRTYRRHFQMGVDQSLITLINDHVNYMVTRITQYLQDHPEMNHSASIFTEATGLDLPHGSYY